MSVYSGLCKPRRDPGSGFGKHPCGVLADESDWDRNLTSARHKHTRSKTKRKPIVRPLQYAILHYSLDLGGKSHHGFGMSAPTNRKPKAKAKVRVVDQYDIAADAKRRINLRGTKTKYFRVKALSNGSYLLEPRVLVPAEAISERTLKMLDTAAMNLRKGMASAPIDLSGFLDA
jgi:hypothetical protein